MTPAPARDAEHRLTLLLRRMSEGDPEAGNEAAEAVYSELRRLAHKAMPPGGSAASLQPTLLVNEAFVRLLRGDRIEWQDRQHFYLLCGRMMRRIVVDYFRERNAQKRPQRLLRTPVEDAVVMTEERRDEVLVVDEALTKLEQFDPRAARVVELRYFLGLSEGEIAELLNLGMRTVRRDWAAAQAWLKKFLTDSN